MAEDHFKGGEHEGRLARDAADARKLHHLASADPEPERGDGTLTGPAHEEKYGLERAEASAQAWRDRGVHPTENRALVDDEDGAENLRGAEVPTNVLETAAAAKPAETADAPRPTAQATAPSAS